jgi:DNA ligase (NAD+)
VHEHSQRIELLEKWGFKVSPTYKKCSNIHEVFEYIDYWEKRRLELPVDTDGVVIKVNNLRQQEKLGYTAKSPRWAISYKYKSLDASTELLKVTYQVGRTGAITPVANLRPVKLAGTEVKRASLHNANEILRLDLREGDTVFVVKGGEIIPKITGVDLTKRKPNSKAIEYVDHCPACDTKLVRNEGEAVHYCPNNKGCPTQIIGRIEHFIQRQAMDIDSLGGRTIALLFEKGLVKTPADLYKLKYEDIYQLEGFKDQSTRNLLNGIEGSKESPFPNVLFALGIRFVGKTVAENLASRFENIDNLANASYEELIATPEIGERIAGSVVEYFKDPDNIRLIDELKSTGLCFETKNINIDSANHVLNGKTFVISGVFENYERDDLKELIKNKGGKVLSSVSAKLDCLLAGENMGPAKREKAQQLGVKIISEKDFINMIE